MNVSRCFAHRGCSCLTQNLSGLLQFCCGWRGRGGEELAHIHAWNDCYLEQCEPCVQLEHDTSDTPHITRLRPAQFCKKINKFTGNRSTDRKVGENRFISTTRDYIHKFKNQINKLRLFSLNMNSSFHAPVEYMQEILKEVDMYLNSNVSGCKNSLGNAFHPVYKMLTENDFRCSVMPC